jgi:hypothetical protein
MSNSEYIRRNQICGEAAGLRSGLILLNARIRRNPKAWPKWLREGLEQAQRRAEDIFEEMPRYRDEAL